MWLARTCSLISGLTYKSERPNESPEELSKPPATDKPVKVYILSGQSNMGGSGQVSGGSTRWGKQIIDPVVSGYPGPYSAEADYDSMTPIATKELPVYGGVEPTPFPGGGTQVVRGFIELASDGVPAPPAFTPLRVGELQLANRIVVSPMCQYSATDGLIDDWHLVHLGSRALGGAGLVITEMTDVSVDGRITTGCAGLYSDEHTAAWKRAVDFVHAHTPAKIGIQLAHAGRKGSTSHPWDGDDTPLTEGAWQTIGPDARPFRPDWPAPTPMDRAAMDRVRDEFVAATRRAASIAALTINAGY